MMCFHKHAGASRIYPSLGKEAMLVNTKYSNNLDVDYWGFQWNTLGVLKGWDKKLGLLISFDYAL